jgi:hypothetical protein
MTKAFSREVLRATCCCVDVGIGVVIRPGAADVIGVTDTLRT